MRATIAAMIFGNWRAALNLWLGNRVRWQRGGYREAPALHLGGLGASQRERIGILNSKYHAAFEQRFDTRNSLENYLYLEILDGLRNKAASHWPRGGQLLDVGSKNFYYAPVLHTVFAPDRLTGVELEGYRLYANLYSRYDYAMAYIEDLPNTHFVVADIRKYRQTADIITCFYPFVFEDTHVNWRLPVKAFDPTSYFDALQRNLAAGGKLVMVNQGIDETEHAQSMCRTRGLVKLAEHVDSNPLIPREPPPIASLWQNS